MFVQSSTYIVPNSNGTVAVPDTEPKVECNSKDDSLFLLVQKMFYHLGNQNAPMPESLLSEKEFLTIKNHIERYPDSLHYRDGCGHTPLMLVGMQNCLELIDLFIEQGANPFIRDFNGENLFDLSKCRDIQWGPQLAVVDYLVQRYGENVYNRYAYGVRTFRMVCCVDLPTRAMDRFGVLCRFKQYVELKSQVADTLKSHKHFQIERNRITQTGDGYEIVIDREMINIQVLVSFLNDSDFIADSTITIKRHTPVDGPDDRLPLLDGNHLSVSVDGSTDCEYGLVSGEYHLSDGDQLFVGIAPAKNVQTRLVRVAFKYLITELNFDAKPKTVAGLDYMFGIPINDIISSTKTQ